MNSLVFLFAALLASNSYAGRHANKGEDSQNPTPQGIKNSNNKLTPIGSPPSPKMNLQKSSPPLDLKLLKDNHTRWRAAARNAEGTVGWAWMELKAEREQKENEEKIKAAAERLWKELYENITSSRDRILREKPRLSGEVALKLGTEEALKKHALFDDLNKIFDGAIKKRLDELKLSDKVRKDFENRLNALRLSDIDEPDGEKFKKNLKEIFFELDKYGLPPSLLLEIPNLMGNPYDGGKSEYLRQLIDEYGEKLDSEKQKN